MDVQLINQELLRKLHEKAAQNERLRMKSTDEPLLEQLADALIQNN